MDFAPTQQAFWLDIGFYAVAALIRMDKLLHLKGWIRGRSQSGELNATMAKD